MPCRQDNDAEIELFADLISDNSFFKARNPLMAVENWPVSWLFSAISYGSASIEISRRISSLTKPISDGLRTPGRVITS